jgi:hypothetical protein
MPQSPSASTSPLKSSSSPPEPRTPTVVHRAAVPRPTLGAAAQTPARAKLTAKAGVSSLLPPPPTPPLPLPPPPRKLSNSPPHAAAPKLIASPVAVVAATLPPALPPSSVAPRRPPPLPVSVVTSSLQRAQAPAVTLTDTEFFDDEDPRATAHTPPPAAPTEPPRRSKLGWLAAGAVVVGAVATLALAAGKETHSSSAGAPTPAPTLVATTTAPELEPAAIMVPQSLAKGKVTPTKPTKAGTPVSKRAAAPAKTQRKKPLAAAAVNSRGQKSKPKVKSK